MHEWAYALAGFREPHGMAGGETNVDNDVVEEARANTGATVMGRRMFSGGEGPWDEDPNADAWWGDDPPFHHPCVRGHPPPSGAGGKAGGTTFTFVTEGTEAAPSRPGRPRAARTWRWAGARAWRSNI